MTDMQVHAPTCSLTASLGGGSHTAVKPSFLISWTWKGTSKRVEREKREKLQSCAIEQGTSKRVEQRRTSKKTKKKTKLCVRARHKQEGGAKKNK